MTTLRKTTPLEVDSPLVPVRLPAEQSPADAALVVPGQLRVCLVVAAEHTPAAARVAPHVLSPQERARAAGLRHAVDRDSYIATHVALRRVLGGYLGRPPGAVALGRDPCPGCGEPHGRPVLPGGGLHFSISHCGGLSLLAFAPAPVGVDLERVPDARTIDEVAEVLHPGEVAELAALPPGERAVAFTRVWTRKEAFLKGLGIGLADDPAGHYAGSGPVPAASPGWAVTDVLVPGGHRAAVALRFRPGCESA